MFTFFVSFSERSDTRTLENLRKLLSSRWSAASDGLCLPGQSQLSVLFILLPHTTTLCPSIQYVKIILSSTTLCPNTQYVSLRSHCPEPHSVQIHNMLRSHCPEPHSVQIHNMLRSHCPEPHSVQIHLWAPLSNCSRPWAPVRKQPRAIQLPSQRAIY